MYVLESSVGGGHVGRACVCVGEDEELKPDGVGRITDKRMEAADGGVAWSINVVRTSNVKPADAGGRRRTPADGRKKSRFGLRRGRHVSGCSLWYKCYSTKSKYQVGTFGRGFL